MAYFVDSSPAVGIPGEVHATAKNKVGSVRLASDGFYYIYLNGCTSCASKSVVVFQTGVWLAALIATGLKGGVAIATGAVDTATKAGWFLYIGQDTLVAKSAIASNVPLFAGAISGYVDDTAVKGDQILNAYCRNAAAADTSAIIQINRASIGHSNESTG